MDRFLKNLAQDVERFTIKKVWSRSVLADAQNGNKR